MIYSRSAGWYLFHYLECRAMGPGTPAVLHSLSVHIWERKKSFSVSMICAAPPGRMLSSEERGWATDYIFFNIQGIYKVRDEWCHEPTLDSLHNDATTTPRTELLAAPISMRLFETVQIDLKQFFLLFTGKVLVEVFGDRSIVLSQLLKDSFCFT